MKKIILTLGLSIAFTVSPALAANLIDPIDPLPLTVSEPRKTYIKPFVGYGISPNQVLTELDLNKLSNLSSRMYYENQKRVSNVIALLNQKNLELSAEGQCKVGHVLFGGIDIGRDINDYFGIAGEIGYHHFQGNSAHGSITAKIPGAQGVVDVTAQLPSLGCISCMLKPVISIIHSESFSFYVTGGIGISYGMLFNPGNINLSLKDELGNNSTLRASVSEFLNGNGTNPPGKGGIQQQLDNFSKVLIHPSATTSDETKSASFGMSWMLGAGLTIDISDYTKLDIGYNYKKLGYIPISEKSAGIFNDINIYCHSVHLGVRVYL